MIKIANLTKNYGPVTVLNIPELEIPAGESFGLVGNNGAGKTTMFRCILDLIRPDSGTVSSKEVNIAASRSWKTFTGSYLDDGFLIDFFTPEEYFTFVADVYGLKEGDLASFYSDFEEFFGNDILNKKKLIRDFSSGNRQRIGIAGALMPKPEVIVLDEPFNSLDPTTQIRIVHDLKTNQDTLKVLEEYFAA
ncbi:MAG: ABC transporter ATP-binding protein [Bacteroidales bacterium]|nr:ABC transporter ATP-binding protein [Bacteroidales bacterium]